MNEQRAARLKLHTVNIKGKKISLRPACFQDRKNIYDWLANSDITSCMLGPPHFPDNPIPTWEEFVDDYNPLFFSDDDPSSGRSFIIIANDEDVGHINYNEVDRENSRVELDIWLKSSAYCNKGYGTDAILTLVDYLSKTLGCRKFIIAPSARNDRAVRSYEKAGFVRSEDIPENFIPDYKDTVVMIKNLS